LPFAALSLKRGTDCHRQRRHVWHQDLHQEEVLRQRFLEGLRHLQYHGQILENINRNVGMFTNFKYFFLLDFRLK